MKNWAVTRTVVVLGCVTIACSFSLAVEDGGVVGVTRRTLLNITGVRNVSGHQPEEGTNVTTPIQFTLDTRTPPKILRQLKKPSKNTGSNLNENSHPGIAIPVAEEDLAQEEHVLRRIVAVGSTTDVGISTWILLNSQTVPSSPLPSPTPTPGTSKTPGKKPTLRRQNVTEPSSTIAATEAQQRLRPRPTTTVFKSETAVPARANTTRLVTDNEKRGRENGTLMPGGVESRDGEAPFPAESKSGEVELGQSAELSGSVKKVTRKPTASAQKSKKKKSNKKKRRPASEKSEDQVTALIDQLTATEKPIGSQIYSYLSREIMPTVGVGLVGLVVTAGLAGYFLYPFGVARRSYGAAIDRKDTGGSYRYDDAYSLGGIDEEEVIGKVIAGMPSSASAAAAADRKSYRFSRGDVQVRRPNYGSPHIATPPPQPSASTRRAVPDVLAGGTPPPPQPAHAPTPNRPVAQRLVRGEPFHRQNVFVAGDVHAAAVNSVSNAAATVVVAAPQATPAVVPEHGPRNLHESASQSVQAADFLEHEPRRRRKKRSAGHSEPNHLDNEIDHENDKEMRKKKREEMKSAEDAAAKTTTSRRPGLIRHETIVVANAPVAIAGQVDGGPSVMSALKDLLELKIKIGLEFLQNTANSVSRYISEVRRRFTASRQSASAAKH